MVWSARGLALSTLIALGMSVSAIASSHAAAPPKVYVAEVRSAITPLTAEYLRGALSKAEDDDADLLLVEMDTPGGLMSAMDEIVKSFLAAKVPVCVYVSPSGARAASAGVWITLAANVAAMAPGTHIGAASPVQAGGGDIPETMKSKVMNDAAASIRSVAQQRGRDQEWAEMAVRDAVSIQQSDALEKHVIDLVASSRADLLAQLNGREVTVGGVTRTLRTTDAIVTELPRTMRQKALEVVVDPNVAYLLLVLAGLGIFFELSNPGAIIPGVVGVIAALLSGYAFQIIPVNWAGALLMLFAMILFIIEVKTPSHGFLAMGGIASLLFGSFLLTWDNVGFMQISWWTIIPTSAFVALFFLTIVAKGLLAQARRPQTGVPALVGRMGEVRVQPSGPLQVYADGALWQADGPADLRDGDPVRIETVKGLRVSVKRA